MWAKIKANPKLSRAIATLGASAIAVGLTALGVNVSPEFSAAVQATLSGLIGAL